MMCNTAIVLGKELSNYTFGEKHPFNSHRLDAFGSKITRSQDIGANNLKVISPVMADEGVILLSR
jgi:hypothetical protein